MLCTFSYITSYRDLFLGGKVDLVTWLLCSGLVLFWYHIYFGFLPKLLLDFDILLVHQKFCFQILVLVATGIVQLTLNLQCTFNPLRTMVAYMRQGNKYFTVHKQIIITSPAFTL